MSTVNLASQELAIKLVYYGPGLGGKTTSLQYIHRALKPGSRGQLISLATGNDRTLYFDFLPIRLPKLGGFKVRVALYTVPGQVHYNATRKLVLANADGIVFVADSQRERMLANLESVENLSENLREQGRKVEDVPLVFQYNKRDAADPVPVVELEQELNPRGLPSFETIAPSGKGVFETLKEITTLVIQDIRAKGAPSPRTPAPPPRKTSPRSGLPSLRTAAAAARADAEPEPAQELTAQSLAELAKAIERMHPDDGASETGSFTAADRDPRSLSHLIENRRAASAVVLAEEALEQGRWDDAVRHVEHGFRRLAARLGGTARAGDVEVLAALIAGVPAQRFLRFRELLARVGGGGGVAETDALFALFFLTDVALRLEERRDERS